MRTCPICRETPVFHHARNVTFRERRPHSILWACDHFDCLRDWRAIPDIDRAALEVRVNRLAELIFEDYTANWPETNRLAFKARIWPGAESPESTGEPWEAFEWVKQARDRLRTLPGLSLPKQEDDCPY